MNYQSDRRNFLKAGAGIAAAGGFTNAARTGSAQEAESSSEKIVLGIMGVNGRGKAIARGMMAQPNVEIGTICDVDRRAAELTAKLVAKDQGTAPNVVGDFRNILDDDKIDVLVCAAPNHWHAPATILGCKAGKHVYVEKPCSHTAEEGEIAIAAARNNDRVVQMGTQRRSWPALVKGIGKVHDGAIGDTLYARTWYNNRRGPIGKGKTTAAPEWLDWDLWQGPAARQEFKDNVVHYNWHWHWNWGNGELGNNGVHGIDVARWGLGVTYPESVTATGGRFRHDDDQETPDTMMVSMKFPNEKMITWEGLSWSPLGALDASFGVSIHGTEGSIVIRGSGYTLYDMKNKEIETETADGGDADHFADFLDAVRTGRKPNADIEIAHQSTLLCHLGNIAYRTGSVVKTDPANGHIVDNAHAQDLWGREYAEGWKPKA
ncbi:Gfo/Idh/MocA family protein [Planctomycetes bacterium K23_9]|uniref:Putative oxidoreductase YdgJ n=1 Tax=Stieleria marina TaxID=1930275 RepID=A0A517NUT7_9BACT|nr:putative oxidoreductase YdgJ [Planctomycetes bacterium K23_9]